MSREKILITTSWISTIGNAILSVSKIIIGLFAGSLYVLVVLYIDGQLKTGQLIY